MANKRPIQIHKDSNFLIGFQRYFLIDYILESKSWRELSSRIIKFYHNKRQSDFYKEMLFKEFKFYSLVKAIEITLADSFMSLLIDQCLIKTKEERVKEIFSQQIRNYREIDDIKLNELLSLEDIIDLRGLLNPFCIFDLCGYGLGDIKAFIYNHTKDFDKRDALLEKLSNFIGYRNLIFHNLLSSRINLGEEIDQGLSLGTELQHLLEDLLKRPDKQGHIKPL